MDRNINRHKILLAEENRSNRWLTILLGGSPSTAFKWCANVCQSSLEPLIQIVTNLEFRIQELIREKELI